MERFALVTGSSRGLGEAFSADLKERGYKVCGISRNESPHLDFNLQIDLSSPEAVQKFIDDESFHNIWQDVSEEFVLINNAGSLGKMGAGVTAETMSNVYQLNVITPCLLMYRSARSSANKVKILNVSSGAATNPYPGWQEYCSTKAALSMASKVFAKDVAEGVTVKNKSVSVLEYAPGVVNTKMQQQIREADKVDFPNQEKFVGMFNDGDLVTAEKSAKKGLDKLFSPLEGIYTAYRYTDN